MPLILTPEAEDDLRYWQKFNPKIYAKIKTLIRAVLSDPYSGIGKPEPLKYQYSGCWSRRIDQQYRLVYRVDDACVTILQCRYHYG